MSTSGKLEERVARLEETVFGNADYEPAPDAWRKTIGMFADDPLFDDFVEECERIREADREEAKARDNS